MSTIIQFRRGTASEWTSVNPTLAEGEKGYETDSIGTEEALSKIGDGVNDWDNLPYQVSGKVKSVNGKEGDVVLDGTEIELINGGGVSVTQAISDLSTDVDGKVQSVTGDGVGGTATNPFLTFPTPTEINLGNVNNTSDANKPVSTAQQTALDDKVAIATNPSKIVKGAIKAFYDVSTSTLEISIDGVDIP